MNIRSVNFLLMILLPFGFYYSVQTGQDFLMYVLLAIFGMNMFMALIL